MTRVPEERSAHVHRFARLDARLVAAAIIIAAQLAMVAETGMLRAPVRDDEVHYWQAVEYFLASPTIDLEVLRGYSEQNTPLAFVLWAGWERLFGGGLTGGRFLVLAFTVATMLLVGIHRPPGDWAGVYAVLGLMLFPSLLDLSTFLYTDPIAVFLTVAGLACWFRGWGAGAALAFALAIATRQFAIVVPAALAAHEGLRWWQGGERNVPGGASRAGWAALATASGLVWWVIWDGPVPPGYAGVWGVPEVAAPQLNPEAGIRFLATLGLYFVVLETIAFHRWHWLRELTTKKSLIIAAGVLVATAIDPPLYSWNRAGPFERALHELAGSAITIAIITGLAWLACVRFARFDLPFCLVAGQWLLSMKVFGWEKYHLLPLAALWYMRSLAPLSRLPIGIRHDGRIRVVVARPTIPVRTSALLAALPLALAGCTAPPRYEPPWTQLGLDPSAAREIDRSEFPSHLAAEHQRFLELLSESLGVVVVAYEPSRPSKATGQQLCQLVASAALTPSQIEQLQSAERALGLTLVAYEAAIPAADAVEEPGRESSAGASRPPPTDTASPTP